MKLVSRKLQPNSKNQQPIVKGDAPIWKILLVDDDPDIIAVTRLSLRNFTFLEYGLEILQANSAKQAKNILHEHDDIAVLIIDVVMETDTAGLDLVHYIRDIMHNRISRIVISTGQPGLAPERYVIDNYDIDNYLTKTELTSQNLYAKLRLAIKGYRDLNQLKKNRDGLRRILSQTPKVYALGRQSESAFFEAVLNQVALLCLSDSSNCSLNAAIASVDGDHAKIEHAMGTFCKFDPNSSNLMSLLRKHQNEKYQKSKSTDLPSKNILMALNNIGGETIAFVVIEDNIGLGLSERSLVEVFLNQCSSYLESIRLYNNLEKAYQKSINTLAEIAEFKDKDTAEHINRMASYTEQVAIEMGRSPETAAKWGQASRLHDVGKMAIPDSILLKPGKLTAEEFDMMRRHTIIGATILGNMHDMGLARDIALSHHEHWDGSGYPEGRVAEETPLAARIVGIADVFDALVNVRCYKAAWSIEDAIKYIKSKSGMQFDPKVTEAFLKLHSEGIIQQLMTENESKSSPK